MNEEPWERVWPTARAGVVWQPTPRMMAAIDLAATGMTNGQIAEMLKARPSTIKDRFRTVAQHWEISERAGLVGEAFRRGLLVARPGVERLVLGAEETALIRALAAGESKPQVALRMELRRITVNRRVNRLVGELEARNLVHAVAIWQARGETTLLPAPPARVARRAPALPAFLMQVLDLLAAGASREQIAARLGVGRGVVDARMARLRELAQCREDVGIVGWAYGSGTLVAPARAPVAVSPPVFAIVSHLARGTSIARAAQLMRITGPEASDLLDYAMRVMRVRTPVGLVVAAFATGVLRPWPSSPAGPAEAARGPTRAA